MSARRAVVALAVGALLAGPAALAFARGGFFDEARLWGGIAAWVLVACAAVVAPRPWPRGGPALAALVGMAGLLGLTLLSLAWTSASGTAVDDAQRAALYLGWLIAGMALLRGFAARWVEPAVAAGTVAAVVYGLSERVLPGLVELARSPSAAGRLEQPLTYWNAMGALAAMGLVLGARLAGDGSRPAGVRTAAAASAGALGAGIALSFSRGAIAAAVLGLALLAALAPAARRAVLVTGGAALAAGAVAAALPAVRTFEGARTAEGLVLLAVLLVAGAAAALTAVAGAARLEPARRLRPRTVVAAFSVAVAMTAAAAALERSPEAPAGASATRLASAESNRYGYWRVALGSFAAAPVLGHGAGSFSVEWLRERDVERVVRDAHSLELETAAELGIAGLGLLALLLGGVAAAAAGALRRDRAAAAGPSAALAVWAAHSALDWDWEMPALTLAAIVLAAALLAGSDGQRPGRPPAAWKRVVTVLAATAVAAALAVELRSANLVAAARASGLRGDLSLNLDRLRRAERLTLDRTTPQLERAKLLLLSGREHEGATLGEEIVAREPENALAWGIVGIGTRRTDPARSREALAEQRRLIGRAEPPPR